MMMRVGVRDVEAALDDGRAHQDVGLVVVEAEHHLLERRPRPSGRAPTRMRACGTSCWSHSACRSIVSTRLWTIEDLAAPVQLAQDGVRSRGLVVAADVGAHRQAVLAAASRSVLMSRMPASAMCSVRGIGVAVMRQHVDAACGTASASPCARRRTAAPRRRSAGPGPGTSRPCESSRCVPMTTSTVPFFEVLRRSPSAPWCERKREQHLHLHRVRRRSAR